MNELCKYVPGSFDYEGWSMEMDLALANGGNVEVSGSGVQEWFKELFDSVCGGETWANLEMRDGALALVFKFDIDRDIDGPHVIIDLQSCCEDIVFHADEFDTDSDQKVVAVRDGLLSLVEVFNSYLEKKR